MVVGVINGFSTRWPFFLLLAASALAVGAFAEPSRAGDPGPLCDAVRNADVVAEYAFESQGKYPAIYREKRWAPPAKEIEKTATTARLDKVHKGTVASDAVVPSEFGFANRSVPWWETFFTIGSFTGLVLLKEREGWLESVGWIEDSPVCHVSWCYNDFKKAVRACLAAETPAEKKPEP